MEYADLLVCAAGDDGVAVVGEDGPYRGRVSLQHCRFAPLAYFPQPCLHVPAAADNVFAVLTDIQRAHIVAMSDQKSVGVVVEVLAGPPYVDDLVLAA